MIVSIKPYTFTPTTKPKTPTYKLLTENKSVKLETYSEDCTFERHYLDGTIEKGVKNDDGTYTYKIYKKELKNGIPTIKTIY